MNAIEADSQKASIHSKPCARCRQRKVRCDKTRPCSNCVRTQQTCRYESPDGREIYGTADSTALRSSDHHLQQRLARLESLVASNSVAENATGQSSQASQEIANQTHSRSAGPPISPSPAITASRSFEPYVTFSQNTTSDTPSGQLVFQEGYSAYFDPDFWPVVISEVEDLRRLFDASKPEDSISRFVAFSAVGISPPSSGPDLALVHPTIEESNRLCKFFFQCVNPFIRIVHESLFARELDQYRRGTFILPAEFEAYLYAIYTLTINSLRAEVVERLWGYPKATLLARFHHSTQVAMAKVNFHKSEKIHSFAALLYYLTFLFQSNLYKDGIALLGVAARVAQSLGMHKDPSHFPVSPWVSEIRRRSWNHLCVLDSIALSSYGAESCLPAATSDARPPQNANDSDWHASRFAKPSSVPSHVVGFKDMTFALVHREISDMTRELARIDVHHLDERDAIINRVEAHLAEEYLCRIDNSKPSQTITAAFVQVKLASPRLSIRYRRCENAEARQRVFLDALDLLETYEYHSAAFAPLNWEWIFESTVPWLATAIVLTCRPEEIELQSETARRAQFQLDHIFNRFSDPLSPISNSPVWQLLVQLRQHVQAEPNQNDPLNGSGLPSGPTASNTAASTLDFMDDDFMLDIGDDTHEANLGEYGGGGGGGGW